MVRCKKESFLVRLPGIEPGSLPWQGSILPLDHRRSRTTCSHAVRSRHPPKLHILSALAFLLSASSLETISLLLLTSARIPFPMPLRIPPVYRHSLSPPSPAYLHQSLYLPFILPKACSSSCLQGSPLVVLLPLVPSIRGWIIMAMRVRA